jgi:hypothetical protein
MIKRMILFHHHLHQSERVNNMSEKIQETQGRIRLFSEHAEEIIDAVESLKEKIILDDVCNIEEFYDFVLVFVTLSRIKNKTSVKEHYEILKSLRIFFEGN